MPRLDNFTKGLAIGIGVAILVPTFVVPVLLVTHVMIFARLIGQRKLVAASAS